MQSPPPISSPVLGSPAMGGLTADRLTSVNTFAWNADRSMIALCPNSNIVEIYHVGGPDQSQWTLVSKLEEHDHLVTCIDWAPRTNKLLTCSQDRNAHVWTLDPATGKWKPQIVLLRFIRGASCCCWSPDENKFAVGSSDRAIAVCYYDSEMDWWVSKRIKKHTSTVLSIAWHPNNCLIATGSSDCTCRVFSAFLKSLDKGKAQHPSFADGDKPLPFGSELFNYNLVGPWVTHVAWSPSGDKVCFTASNSTLTVVDFTGPGAQLLPTPPPAPSPPSSATPGTPPPASAAREEPPHRKGVIMTTRLRGLPLVTCMWLDEGNVVAAGHDFSIGLFQPRAPGAPWQFVNWIDQAAPKAKAPTQVSAASAAFKIFEQQSSRGQLAPREAEKPKTAHDNLITTLRAYQMDGPSVVRFSSCGLDGKVYIWQRDGQRVQ